MNRTACSSLLLALAVLQCMALAAPAAAALPASPIPIAYAVSKGNGDHFILYGHNGVTDLRKTFPSADFFCRAYAGGALASIRYENETKVLLALDRYANYNVSFHSSFTTGNETHNGVCNWMGQVGNAPGHAADNADAVMYTDGTEILQKTQGKREGNYKNGTYFEAQTFPNLPWCAALCNAKNYMRDCEAEYHNFICRTAHPPHTINASGVVHLTDFVKPCGSPTTPPCPKPKGPDPNVSSRCMAAAGTKKVITAAATAMSKCFPPSSSSFSFTLSDQTLTCQRPAAVTGPGPLTCVVA